MDKDLVYIIGGAVGFFILLVVGIYALEMNVTCPRFGNAVERPYKYVLFGGGCFVKDFDGRWVLKENYWNSPQSTSN